MKYFYDTVKNFTKYYRQHSAKQWKDYFFSTHFLGPLVNYGLPLAAIADFQKSPEFISGKMTVALLVYSSIFSRFAWRVQPRNMLLLSCHLLNLSAQSVQMVRFLNHNYLNTFHDPYCKKDTTKKEKI